MPKVVGGCAPGNFLTVLSKMGLKTSMIYKADILKVSDEEAILLTGEKDISKAAFLLLQCGPKIVEIGKSTRLNSSHPNPSRMPSSA